MPAYVAQMKRTASTTLSVGSLIGSTSRRLRLSELTVGSEATPADNVFSWLVRRCTTVGTATAVTPIATDPADPAPSSTANENYTVEPTVTANSELLDIPLNQRATYRWNAISPEHELVVPATASNGLLISTPVASAVLVSALAMFRE